MISGFSIRCDEDPNPGFSITNRSNYYLTFKLKGNDAENKRSESLIDSFVSSLETIVHQEKDVFLASGKAYKIVELDLFSTNKKVNQLTLDIIFLRGKYKKEDSLPELGRDRFSSWKGNIEAIPRKDKKALVDDMFSKNLIEKGYLLTFRREGLCQNSRETLSNQGKLYLRRHFSHTRV